MQAHNLFRLTQKLYGTPLLIEPNSFNTIEAYLTNRNLGLMQIAPQRMPEKEQKPDDIDDVSGVGVIEIHGPLTNRSMPMDAMCGAVGMSYEGIVESVDALIEAGATTIVMCFDSGGGEAYGVFEAADRIRSMCDDAGVSLLSYIDGSCCSAAYAIACAADAVICNPYGECGSIGVMVKLQDDSEHMKQEGHKDIYIYAGKEKVPFADDGSFKPEFLSKLQAKVDMLYMSFSSHISKYTGLSTDEVMGMEAKCFLADDAKANGLVNEIMSHSDFVDYIVNKQQESIND